MMDSRTHPSHADRLIAAARVANAAFFLLTATYCLLTYTPFAYQQFIRPHLINWVSQFVVFHHIGYWLALGITALTMLRELPRVRARAIGWAYLVTWGAAGVALLVSPVLPRVENDGRGLILALLSLVPPIWLAIYDHAATGPRFSPIRSSEARVLKAILLAGGVVWLQQTVAVPWRLGNTGEITLTPAGVLLGILTSGITHLLVFSVLAVFIVAVLRGARATGMNGPGEYWLLVISSAVVATLVSYHIVFGSISFRGRDGWFTAALLGALAAIVWSGIARRLNGERRVSTIEILTAPLPGIRSRPASLMGLVALGAVGYVSVSQLMTFDWDFLLQKLALLATWAAVCAYCHAAIAGGAERPRWGLVVAPLVAALTMVSGCTAVQPRLGSWMGQPAFVSEFVLEGYEAVDPSFRLVRYLLHVESAEDAAFYDLLRAHSDIRRPVAPVDIDFVRPLPPAAGPKPHIFLFVIDSLRRDYLGPYNNAVRFTPSIDRFAADSVVFDRAFTRYSGTGLSMPAIWSGGMVLHKQYIAPFSPLNTLEKLLDVNDYRRVFSPDHITVQLLTGSEDDVALDAGVPEMEYDFCRTAGELAAKLQQDDLISRPVFAHTRSLNLHIAHIRGRSVPEGKSYAGFLAPAAAEIERMDACFGGFVANLQRLGLYDRSIIALTSDHGDGLGEALHWGHANDLRPSIVRVPLIVRVPPDLKDRFLFDPQAVSFSADLAPTFYALLGYRPADLGPLFGAPLFAPQGSPRSARATGRFLIGSSYGAVYGVVSENGRNLYIADALNARDFGFDMSGMSARRIGVTRDERGASRAFIRAQLEELARLHHFEPAP
jgi:hypothetical protein